MSICAAVAIYFLMPDYPSNSRRFLTEEESILACNRLAVDGIDLTQGSGAENIPHWVAFKMTCSDWRVWAQCLLFVLVTGSQTMQYFIPTLVQNFGWTGPSGQCKIYHRYYVGLQPLSLMSRPYHSSLRRRPGLRRCMLLAGGQVQGQVAVYLRSVRRRLRPLHCRDHGPKQDGPVRTHRLRLRHNLRLLSAGQDVGRGCHSPACGKASHCYCSHKRDWQCFIHLLIVVMAE